MLPTFCEESAERRCKRSFCQNVFGSIAVTSAPDDEMGFLSCCSLFNLFTLKSADA